MTRDHKYMTRVLDTILVAWMHAPELRLGQLIDSAGQRYDAAPTFYIEDDKLTDAVQRLDQEVLCKHTLGTSSGNSSGV